MAVRYGPARVTFSGDETRAHGFLGEALHLLRSTQERADLGGLQVLSNQRRLDADSYCYVVIAGGISAVHIVAGQVEQQVASGVEPTSIPDFVSGVIDTGFIYTLPTQPGAPESKVLRTYKPTLRCSLTYEVPHAYQSSGRLAVEPWAEFAEVIGGETNGDYQFSQYNRLKPTMYSGTMRKVVQLCMGFGRQRREGGKEYSQYDAGGSPDTVGAKPDSSDYAKAVANKGLQIRYDWRFGRTHGVTRAADGRWWLVEISITQGALAMPLPLNTVTGKASFYQRLHDANDEDGLAALDLLGGFPTGETFPPGKQMEAWIRAGRVVRMMDVDGLDPFYMDHSPYSSVMGWAFNALGSEAHNTAWRVEADGYLRGIHESVMLAINASAPAVDTASPGAISSLLAVLRFAQGERQYSDRYDAAVWKISRMSSSQVKMALRRGNERRVFDYVDALVLDPPATGSARRVRMSEGYLVHRGKTGNLIKFPEPELGLLVSMDMRPERVHEDKLTRSDTVVHVFFDGQQLKWVKYFNDEREGAPPFTTDDFEPCMYIGAWTQDTQYGNSTILPALYSNDFDDRIETAASTRHTTIKGDDLGYSQVFINDCLPWLVYAQINRMKRYRTTTETITTAGKSIGTGVAVPFYDREAYYYAVHTNEGQKTHLKQVNYKYLLDPWSYRTFRVVAGYGSTTRQHPDGCGPGLRQRTVMLPQHDTVCRNFSDRDIEGPAVYQPGGCSDFADTGPWSSLCVNADAQAYWIPEPPSSSTFETAPVEAGYTVWIVSSSGLGPQRLSDIESAYFGLWPLRSPLTDIYTSADQRIEEISNALGEAQSMRVQINLNDAFKVIGKPHWPEMESGGLTYIGVIDSG